MTKDATSLEQRLATLAKEFPLVPYTGASCLSSAVRRMKAEKEMTIPVNLRSGFAVSARTGKAADKLTDQEWETFYGELCEQLKRDYPELYANIFPGTSRRGK